MNFKTKMQIKLQGKAPFLKVRINHDSKKTSVHYIKKPNDDFFNIQDCKYKLMGKYMYREDGFDTLTFNYNEIEPIDYLLFTKNIGVSAKELKDYIDEDIARDIIAASNVDYDKLNKKVTVLMVLVGAGFAILSYFLYSKTGEMLELQLKMQELLEVIRAAQAGGR